MFVQSHIQRARHQLPVATQASAATHHVERANKSRPLSQPQPVGYDKTPAAERRQTSLFGEQSNRNNSFFNRTVKIEELVQLLGQLDASSRLACLKNQRQLLEQADWRLAAIRRRREHQVEGDGGGDSNKQTATQKSRLRKSLSLADLGHNQPQVGRHHHKQPVRASLRGEFPVASKPKRLQRSDKWTQVCATNLDQLERAPGSQLVEERERIGLLERWRACWLAAELRLLSGLNLAGRLRVLALFWVNFISFQYETLLQIYRLLTADRPDPMVALNEFHQHQRQQLASSSVGRQHEQSFRDCNYTPVALLEPAEWAAIPRHHQQPSLAQLQPQWSNHKLDHHSHRPHQQSDELESRLQYQPHVHRHNHAGLASYYGDFMPPLAGLATHSRGRPTQREHQPTTSCESGWQRHLRHTVDGSPGGHSDRHRLQAAPSHRPQFHSGWPPEAPRVHILEAQRASLSSPTLHESSLFNWQQQHQASPLPVVARKLVDWQLDYSSDELSVISDREPAEMRIVGPAESKHMERPLASSMEQSSSGARNDHLVAASGPPRGGATTSGQEEAPAASATPSPPTRKKASPLGKVSLAGAKRRLGFKRSGGGLNSLSVHRSEEICPLETAANLLSGSGERRRRQFANSSAVSGSLNDSSCELADSTAVRLLWLNQLRAQSINPKLGFVDGLGAGQIASRQALVSPHLGDIQLGLSDRRGILELEVIRARHLQPRLAAKRLPSPYVKAYLMRGKKCLVKFKTRQARETLDPLYQEQFVFRHDYSNCLLQVIVWADYGKCDKKALMGAAQIVIDDLDMSSLVIGWYKLFNAPSLASHLLAGSSKALRQTMSSSRLLSESSVAAELTG